MPAPLNVSPFDSLPVVVFRNHSTNQVEAHVCQTAEVCYELEAHLSTLSHIEVLASLDAHIERA